MYRTATKRGKFNGLGRLLTLFASVLCLSPGCHPSLTTVAKLQTDRFPQSISKISQADPAYVEVQRRIQTALDTQATELDLSQLGLQALPSEIGQLTNLQWLGLYDNQLTSLPPELLLVPPRRLHLVGNSLPSEIIEQYSGL
ncbi:MAG: hypothetical protein F6K11_26560 [Leptolyngbya sp. SIO3F4]|nr:hypothetical protein [Leptolyngbya sp. SIO3F4]